MSEAKARHKDQAVIAEVGGADRVYRVGQRWQKPPAYTGRNPSMGIVYEIVETFKPSAQVKLWDGFGKRSAALWFPVAHLADCKRIPRETGH